MIEEFERAAPTFSERTQGRFDVMDVVVFSRVRAGDSVVEVGAGTGSFLALFEPVGGTLTAVDVVAAMLIRARARHPAMRLVVGDGRRLPLGSSSADLVASAEVLHHVQEPVPFAAEMRRVAGMAG